MEKLNDLNSTSQGIREIVHEVFDASLCYFKGGPLDGKTLDLSPDVHVYYAYNPPNNFEEDYRVNTVMYKEKLYIENGLTYRYFILE